MSRRPEEGERVTQLSPRQRLAIAGAALAVAAAIVAWLVWPSSPSRPATPAPAGSQVQISDAKLRKVANGACRSAARKFTGKAPKAVEIQDVSRIGGDLWLVTCKTDIDALRLRATIQGLPDGTLRLWRVEVAPRDPQDVKPATPDQRAPLR